MIVTDLSKELYPVPKPLQKNKTAEKTAEIKKEKQ